MTRNPLSPYGCICDSGYYMQQSGCLACDYLVPTCQKCSTTSVNTLIPIHMPPILSSGTDYLSCDACELGRYVRPVNVTSLTE